MLSLLKEAEKIGDMSELWLDEIPDLDNAFLEKILRSNKKPIIYKCTGLLKNLTQVLAFNPEFVDLDTNSSFKLIQKTKSLSPNTKIILSFHDFEKTPKIGQLKKIAGKMVKKKADIIKIATYAKSFEDSLIMMSFLSYLKNHSKTAICLCMGKAGEITRKTGHLLGNYLMYAPVKANQKTASGQINAAKLKKIQQSCL